MSLLREAHRVLHVGGIAGVIHWRRDIETPPGPSLEIRPRPAQCRAWPYRYGVAETLQYLESGIRGVLVVT
jgi:hypothetical protein